MASLAVKNNNPGNLKDPATGTFRVFKTLQEGQKALEGDLTAKVTGNTRTGLKPTSSLYDFASTYAPSSDKNNPKQYAENLAKQLGVTPDIPLSALQPRIHDFANAVAHNEDSSVPVKKNPSPQPQASAEITSAGQLSHDQMVANINAMEKQGAKPDEIQGYLDSLKGSSQSSFNPKPYSQPGEFDLTGTTSTPGETPKPKVDNNYVQNIDPATGKPSQSINWANPPSWIPGSQIGGAIGTQIAKMNPAPEGDILTPFAKSKLSAFQLSGTAPSENVTAGPSAEAVGGDVLRSAAIPAGLLAAPVTIPGMIGTGAALGAAQAGGNAMVQNKSASEVAKQAGIGGLIGGVTSGIVGSLGKMLGQLGDKISFSVIKPSAADIKDGFNIQTIKDNNLGGSLNQTLTKTQALMKDLSGQLAEKLQGSDSSIDLAKVFDDTASELSSKKGTLENFGQTGGLQRVLGKLQDEVLTANPSGALSIPDAQVVKQAAGGMGAWQYGSADPDATATETVYNTFYRKLKEAIEQNSPEGVKEINAKLSDLIPVLKAVIRRIPIAERNNAFSLPDMIGMVGSTMNPGALVPLGLERGAKSGIVGNLLSKAGPAIQRSASTAALGTSGLLGNLK